jgi:hypothetical protein
MDPLTALTALGPLAIDLGKSLINRFVTTDAYKPRSVDEWLAMRKADTELFSAMNGAGAQVPSYPWVAAVISMQRPAVAVCVLSVWAFSKAYGIDSESIDNFASCVGFYLFGDRTLFYSRQSRSAK